MGLQLEVRFHGSWTNVLADANFKPVITSSSRFNDRGVAPREGLMPDPHEPNQGRVAYIRQLNQANPNMLYKVPENYDNTVLGVLARLLGEVRRVIHLEDSHPARELMSKATYKLNIETEHDELTTLATPANELPGSGAGVVAPGNPLYEDTPLAKKLFGHLGLSIEQLLAGEEPTEAWTPKSPSALVLRLNQLKAEQDALTKQAIAGLAEGAEYTSPGAKFCADIAKAYLAAKPDVRLGELIDYWNWAGAKTVLAVATLPEAERLALMEKGILSRNGLLSGMSASGNLGSVSPKDILAAPEGCHKAYSTSMPYSLKVPVTCPALVDKTGKAKRHEVQMGIIKKSGSLIIDLDIDTETAQATLNQFDAAGVGPFHFGKKGLAYLDRTTVTPPTVH